MKANSSFDLSVCGQCEEDQQQTDLTVAHHSLVITPPTDNTHNTRYWRTVHQAEFTTSLARHHTTYRQHTQHTLLKNSSSGWIHPITRPSSHHLQTTHTTHVTEEQFIRLNSPHHSPVITPPTDNTHNTRYWRTVHQAEFTASLARHHTTYRQHTQHPLLKNSSSGWIHHITRSSSHHLQTTHTTPVTEEQFIRLNSPHHSLVITPPTDNTHNTRYWRTVHQAEFTPSLARHHTTYRQHTQHPLLKNSSSGWIHHITRPSSHHLQTTHTTPVTEEQFIRLNSPPSLASHHTTYRQHTQHPLLKNSSSGWIHHITRSSSHHLQTTHTTPVTEEQFIRLNSPHHSPVITPPTDNTHNTRYWRTVHQAEFTTSLARHHTTYRQHTPHTLLKNSSSGWIHHITRSSSHHLQTTHTTHVTEEQFIWLNSPHHSLVITPPTDNTHNTRYWRTVHQAEFTTITRPSSHHLQTTHTTPVTEEQFIRLNSPHHSPVITPPTDNTHNTRYWRTVHQAEFTTSLARHHTTYRQHPLLKNSSSGWIHRITRSSSHHLQTTHTTPVTEEQFIRLNSPHHSHVITPPTDNTHNTRYWRTVHQAEFTASLARHHTTYRQHTQHPLLKNSSSGWIHRITRSSSHHLQTTHTTPVTEEQFIRLNSPHHSLVITPPTDNTHNTRYWRTVHQAEFTTSLARYHTTYRQHTQHTLLKNSSSGWIHHITRSSSHHLQTTHTTPVTEEQFIRLNSPHHSLVITPPTDNTHHTRYWRTVHQAEFTPSLARHHTTYRQHTQHTSLKNSSSGWIHHITRSSSHHLQTTHTTHVTEEQFIRLNSPHHSLVITPPTDNTHNTHHWRTVHQAEFTPSLARHHTTYRQHTQHTLLKNSSSGWIHHITRSSSHHLQTTHTTHVTEEQFIRLNSPHHSLVITPPTDNTHNTRYWRTVHQAEFTTSLARHHTTYRQHTQHTLLKNSSSGWIHHITRSSSHHLQTTHTTHVTEEQFIRLNSPHH